MYLPGGVKTLGSGAFQRTPVEIYDMSDVYSSDFTIGDWCINNWYDTKGTEEKPPEVKPEWADKHKDIYVNNKNILNALLADKKAGSVTKTCYVTNGGTVDMTKTGFDAVSRPGYTVEWHKNADFSDTAYTGEPQNSQNYYAKWTLSANAIEVTYDANISGVTAKRMPYLQAVNMKQKKAALTVPVIHSPDGTQRKMAKALPMRLVILFPRPRILPFMRSGS